MPGSNIRGPAGRGQAPRHLESLQMTLPKDSITSSQLLFENYKGKNTSNTYHALISPLGNSVRPYWETFIQVFTLNTLTSLTLKYMKKKSISHNLSPISPKAQC